LHLREFQIVPQDQLSGFAEPAHEVGGHLLPQALSVQATISSPWVGIIACQGTACNSIIPPMCATVRPRHSLGRQGSISNLT
jgi:hypothetical protein